MTETEFSEVYTLNSDHSNGKSIDIFKDITILIKETNENDAQMNADHIASIIQNELKKPLKNQNKSTQFAIISYYRLINKFNLDDKNFAGIVIDNKLQLDNNADFQLLNAIVQVLHKSKASIIKDTLKPKLLIKDCSTALIQAINDNNVALIENVLTALISLLTKYPTEFHIDLKYIYCLMTINQCSLRDISLQIFNLCCISLEQARQYFDAITRFWPWTNRYKFYLLSCLVQKHELETLFCKNDIQNERFQFFNGIRLALSHKHLLSASQRLIMRLSLQDYKYLLDFVANILTKGTEIEIINLHSQWFTHIDNKQELFEILQQSVEIGTFIGFGCFPNDKLERYRLILIFSMFARQIYALSKIHFFKITTELIMNCFTYDIESQILIYKFVVDNMTNFAIQDICDFIYNFLNEHKSIDIAKIRNEILANIPIVVNYISKMFARLRDGENASILEASIEDFFKNLHRIFTENILSEIYQPKIFALRLFTILFRSLYTDNIVKSTKNFDLKQNQQMGMFLMECKVFEFTEAIGLLCKVLNMPHGFDDVYELSTTMLRELKYDDKLECMENCKNYCKRTDIDECKLCLYFAKAAADCLNQHDAHNELLELFNFAFKSVGVEMDIYFEDPLLISSTKNHLFGYLITINELMLVSSNLLVNYIDDVLHLLENLKDRILKMLNLSNIRCNGKLENLLDNAASFHDMDVSLELLVEQSKYEMKNSIPHEQLRKRLLLSFWLTLKACCDLSTTLGCILINNKDAGETITRCIDIEVSILTRCRHKGAIEAAGVAVGKLVRSITTVTKVSSAPYTHLSNCLNLLLDDTNLVSTTRRGAGFSIMCLHILKNEKNPNHTLLENIVRKMLDILKIENLEIVNDRDSTVDCKEALILHYLRILINDAELTEIMLKFINELLMISVRKSDDKHWAICNAAHQLFCAVVLKIVGQKSSHDNSLEEYVWRPTENTYTEISRQYTQVFNYMLENTFSLHKLNDKRHALIRFLGLLTFIEHLRYDCFDAICENADEVNFMLQIREILWHLFYNRCEQIRRMSAYCFVRAHDFYYDLPKILINISEIFFNIENENFFQSLLFVLIEGINKIRSESLHIRNEELLIELLSQMRKIFADSFNSSFTYHPIVLEKLEHLFKLVGFDENDQIMSKCLHLKKVK